jgi:hypothetical protein
METDRFTLCSNAMTIEVADFDKTSYVAHMIDDLRAYIQELEQASASRQTESVDIVVGPHLAKGQLGELPSNQALGDQGYLIKTLNKPQGRLIVVTGLTPTGTRNGLAAFMRLIRADKNGPSIPAPLDIQSKPSFQVRGMHFNGWAFKHPYSFRSWAEKDWQNYIDILGYQNVNLLYIWPFMEIIPLPVSKEDEEYLLEVRRLVEYAQREHGMEVWLMQAANRVATNNLGVADPRHRPYWRYDVQLDRDPADPKEFQTIMDSHEALYCIVDNADGVCTIDTDPGSWRGSPISDFTHLFQGCRALLDAHTINGRETKQINWMWTGWGLEHDSDPEWIAQTIQAMRDDVPEPWQLISGQPIFLPECEKAGVLDKTVYLHYGLIEDEPSYPWTNIGLGGVVEIFDIARKYPGLRGMMGNTQCPLIQFPRTFHFLECMWDAEAAPLPERRVMVDLCDLLYQDNAAFVADCFLAMEESSVAKLEPQVTKLAKLIEKGELGKPGLFGRKLFPNPGIVAESLLMQLQLRLSLDRMYSELKPTSTRAECAELVEGCLTAYLRWDDSHGWHRLWGNGSWPLGRFGAEPGFAESVRNLRRALGDDDSVQSFFREVGDALTPKFDRDFAVLNGTEAMLNRVLSVAS